MRTYRDLNGRTLSEHERHFQVASAGAKVAEMTVVSYRASRLKYFCAQAAGISGLSAAIVGLRPQSSHRFPFARLAFLLAARGQRTTRLDRRCRSHSLRHQFAIRGVVQIFL